MLFILHTMVNQRKAVVACFRKKIINGHFTPSLLKQSVVNHGDALREYPTIITMLLIVFIIKRYFRDLVGLAEGFLRSTEPPVRRFGVELYTLLFSEFQDKIVRQVYSFFSYHLLFLSVFSFALVFIFSSFIFFPSFKIDA